MFIVSSEERVSTHKGHGECRKEFAGDEKLASWGARRLIICISTDKTHFHYCQFSTIYRIVKSSAKGNERHRPIKLDDLEKVIKQCLIIPWERYSGIFF